jgi:hypothetical protein
MLSQDTLYGIGGDDNALEPGDHHHTDDMRSDQTQYAAFEVRQLGLNLHW